MASGINKSSDLKLVKKIGSGGFSVVFEAIWKGQNVAAKRLNDVDMHEVDILTRLNHPNIVKLIGVEEKDLDTYLILELCRGGSLRSYLDKLRSNGERLPFPHFVDWAKQAAKPIKYLKEMKIVHKDVKSPNYLIADGNVLKLADFGLSKKIAHTISKATERASHPWMAPELLRDGILSPSYDTHAYGVVIWELWTTEVPFEDTEGEGCPHIIWRICNDNERPPIPDDCPKPVADLMRQCWEIDWHKRPSIDHILSVLTFAENEPRQRFIAGPWVLEKEFGHRWPGSLVDAYGIAVNPINGDVGVADYYAAQVKVYSSKGEYKYSLDKTQGLDPGTESQPWNVTVSPDGNYYVTDKTQYVKMYGTEGGYKGRWVTVSPDNKPSEGELRGLTMDAKRQLLVGNSADMYISKHRQDGSHIASFKVGIVPYYLAVTSQDTIIIGEYATKVVSIVDNTGNVLHTLRPTSDVTSWDPWGVCCYEDIIFICNMFSKRICCFFVSGEYLGSIAVTGVPHSITFVKGSNKFLLTCCGMVQVYSCKQFKLLLL